MSFIESFAENLAKSSDTICRDWLDRLIDLLPVEKREIFPTRSLLDHVPILLRGMAADLREPETRDVLVSSAVTEKARELGLLRFAQDASVHQILREFDLLALLLDDFLATAVERSLEEAERSGKPDAASWPAPADIALLSRRIHRALRILVQAAVDAFSERYTQTIEEQRSQLESFNRMVSHELRNPVNTLEIATSLLGENAQRPEEDLQLVDIAGRSVQRISRLLRSLEIITELSDDSTGPTVQAFEIDAVAGSVKEQLEDMAAARQVTVVVDSDLPAIESDSHRVEMILLNLLANGIKYSDPDEPESRVRVSARERGGVVTLVVEDNGIGIPPGERDAVFERFVRVHSDRDAELGVRGSGLGLAIVAECVRALEGEVHLESEIGVGTRIEIAIPRLRTANDSR